MRQVEREPQARQVLLGILVIQVLLEELDLLGPQGQLAQLAILGRQGRLDERERQAQ